MLMLVMLMKFVLKCANTAGSTVTFDNWTVTQKPNCETLSANTMTHKDCPYDTNATTTTVYAASEIFANSKAGPCPIHNCTLKQSDCSADLVAPFDSLLSIEASTPWNLVVS